MTIRVSVRSLVPRRASVRGLSKIRKVERQTDAERVEQLLQIDAHVAGRRGAARARRGQGEVLSVAAEIRVPVLGLAWVGAARCGAGRWGAARSGAATRCRLGLVGGSSATAGCTIASAESKPVQEIKALFMTRPRSCLKYPINEA